MTRNCHLSVQQTPSADLVYAPCMKQALGNGWRKARATIRSMRGQSDLQHLRATGLSFGSGLYIGAHVTIDSTHRHLVTIGDNVTIADRVHILAHDASTKRTLGFTRIGVVSIGNRVFVGANAIILPGVTIGDDTVIGAGSVVTHSLPAGCVATGVPARPRVRISDFITNRSAELNQVPLWESDDWIYGKGLNGQRAREMSDRLSQTDAKIGYLK